METGEDTRVELAVAGPWGVSEASQTAFLGGGEGRRRAALAAAAFLHGLVRETSRAVAAGPASGAERAGEQRVDNRRSEIPADPGSGARR